MIKISKEEAVNRLIKKGLKPVYLPHSKTLNYFEATNSNVVIGNKSWGYLDFLKCSVIRKKQTERKPNDKPRNKTFNIGRAWSFSWHKAYANAEVYIENQKKNAHFPFTILNSSIGTCEDKTFRSTIEGIA